MATSYEPVTTKPQEQSSSGIFQFPPPGEEERLFNYNYYEKLFYGRHFDAFSIKIDNELYGKEYGRLRYLTANFAGLISKIIADLLFIEPPKIKVADGDQEFLDKLISENKLRITNYESALSNSYYGDAVYKVRVGKRYPEDPNDKETIIIEDITPKIYFPSVDPFNVKADPYEKELAWPFSLNGKNYLRKEIHYPGRIENHVYLLEGNQIKTEEDIGILNIPGLLPKIQTNIDRSLIVHIPNWRGGNKHYGLSDYFDLDTLFYGINNRLTKIDNILDKHSDPILAIPEGILNEQGYVKRSALNLFERPPEGTKENDPNYITWDANLESAFKEIDKLVEMTFMMSETSPDILGMGQGQAESGRALKLKLLRTLAKTQRKQLYYREGLIEVLYVAQLMAKAWGIEVDGKRLEGEAVKPEIEWRDGLPSDMMELIEEEVKRIDAGLSTAWESIMRLDDVEEDVAKKKAKEIDAEGKIDLPKMNFGGNPIPGKNGEMGKNAPNNGAMPANNNNK